MGESLIQRSFAGGELAPGLFARADLARYLSALRTCRNFLVRRHGGVANRPGTRFVAETKASAEAFLYPFVFAATHKSLIIEAGDQYFRFHKNGSPVTVSGLAAYNGATAYVPGDLVVQGGTNYYCTAATTGNAPPNATYWYAMPAGGLYEIPTPYEVGRFKDPARACFSQQGLIITITHLDERPRELVYEGDTRWILRDIVTAPSQGAPTAPGGVAGAAGTRTFTYVVTAAAADTYEESLPSAVITIAAAADPTDAAPHVLSWTAPAGTAPAEYYVYGDGGTGNGVFGYLGTSKLTDFRHVGQVSDFGNVPPEPRVLFDTDLRYPAVNTVYQQRRIMAGTHTDRELVYASRVGFRSNFSIRSPLQDDDAVTFRIAADVIQPVVHLVALKRLVVLTDSAEFVIGGDEQGVLRPTAINPDRHAACGSSFVRPAVIGESIVYVQARGTVLRDLRFDQQVEGYAGRDLSLYAAHLFVGYTIDRLAFAQVPDSTVWCVRSDGTLLGLTYIREEDVVGWHRHDTEGGAFQDVCTLPEGAEDAVYVVVQRTIAGQTKRFVERFASRQYAAVANAYHLDAGVTVTNDPASTVIGGLAHLNGATVYALADGVVRGPFTVSGGGITLSVAASTVHVGLRITAQLETLDLDVAGSSVRDRRKLVKALSLLLEQSSRGFSLGPSVDKLYPQRLEAWDTAALFTGRTELNITAGFTEHGRVLLQHTDPTPLTVLAVLPHVEIGG